MSKLTPLASGQITAVDTLIIELVEADETPTVVIDRWPVKATVLHPRRFPDTRGHHCPPVRRGRDNIGSHQGKPATVASRASVILQGRESVRLTTDTCLPSGDIWLLNPRARALALQATKRCRPGVAFRPQDTNGRQTLVAWHGKARIGGRLPGKRGADGRVVPRVTPPLPRSRLPNQTGQWATGHVHRPNRSQSKFLLQVTPESVATSRIMGQERGDQPLGV